MRRSEARDEAIREGRKEYVGAPCLRGHSGRRWVSNNVCLDCIDEKRKRPFARASEARRWRAKHPDKAKAIQRRSARKYMRERRHKDLNFRIMHVLRCRLGKYLRGDCRISAVRHLGCTVEELRLHLERQFRDGMTWENYGRHGWEIDHIKPLALFDLTDPSEAAEAVHYTNLQPLWAADNLAKRVTDGVLRNQHSV